MDAETCDITAQPTRTRARAPCFAKVGGRAPVAANVMRLDLTPYRDRGGFRRLKKSMSGARKWYGERLASDPGYGVGANTLRAFRRAKKPSLIYREWAVGILSRKAFRSKLRNVKTRKAFERFHAWLSRSLDRHWSRKAKKSLSLAHRYKLIDLFVKHAVRLDFGEERLNRNLLAFGHVPIDSSVFSAVDRLLSGILVADGRAMGHIKTAEAYRFYQTLTAELVRPLRAPPLYFDYFAWNTERDA